MSGPDDGVQEGVEEVDGDWKAFTVLRKRGQATAARSRAHNLEGSGVLFHAGARSVSSSR